MRLERLSLAGQDTEFAFYFASRGKPPEDF